MAPKLYVLIGSPAVRSVLLCAKELGLELDCVELDVVHGKQYDPEFLKINPQHTIPTLVDNGFVVWDSHAIMCYLVNKYGKNKSLYPENPEKRATVDQRLHFDSSILFTRGLMIHKGVVFFGVRQIPEDERKGFFEAYDFVEKFLEGNEWVAGDNLTIADFSFLTSISTWKLLLPFEESKYPRITRWLSKMKKLPYYNEINEKGIDQYRELLKERCPEMGFHLN